MEIGLMLGVAFWCAVLAGLIYALIGLIRWRRRGGGAIRVRLDSADR